MKEKLNKNLVRWFQLSSGARIILILTLVQVSASYLVYGLGPLGPFLKTTFDLSYSQLGTINAVFFISMVLSSIPAGSLVDWWGAKRILFLGQILTILCFSILSLAPNYLTYLIGMLIAGIMYSSFQPATNKLIVFNIDKKHVSVGLGFKQMGVSFGAILAGTLIPFFSSIYSWRQTLLVSSLLILTITLIAFFLVPEKKSQGLKNNINNLNDLRLGFLEIIKNHRLIWLIVVGILLDGNQFALNTYLTTWLVETKEVSYVNSGNYYAFVQISGMIGRFTIPLLCFMVFKEQKHVGFLFNGLISVIALFILMIINIKGIWLIVVLFLIGFACFGWIGLLLGCAVEEVNQKYVGFLNGVIYSVLSIGVVIVPIIFGIIVDFSSYRFAWFYLILNASVATLIIYFFLLKPKKILFGFL